MFNIRLFLGMFLSAILISGAIMTGSHPLIFINIPSILIVILPTLAMLFAIHKSDDIRRTFRQAFIGGRATESEINRSLLIVETIGKISTSAGVAGFFIGVVQSLIFAEDPKSLGPALGLSFVTVVYAFIIRLIVVIPLSSIFSSKKLELEYSEMDKSVELLVPMVDESNETIPIERKRSDSKMVAVLLFLNTIIMVGSMIYFLYFYNPTYNGSQNLDNRKCLI